MRTFSGPDWPSILAVHRAEYRRKEEEQVERAARLYRGDAWKQEDRSAAKRDGHELKLVTYNLAYAIVESAISSAVPPNLQFTAYSTDEPETPSTSLEKLLTRCDRVEGWGHEGTLSFLDALLVGRSILKTVPAKRVPATVRAVDPRKVFFDLAARRPSDINYYIELTPMPKREFERKLRRKGNTPAVYKLPEGMDLDKLATTYPAYLSEEAARTSGNEWVPVFEVCDVALGQVTHWVEGFPHPIAIFEEDDFYCPYSLYNLNLNGLDCRGMSELILVEDLLTSINRLLSYWAELVRKQVPLTLYDTTATDEKEMSRIAQAVPGALVGVACNGRRPSEVVENLAVFPIPPSIEQIILKFESMVNFVTGLSDSSRGQITGARTATDLAVAESSNKTRLNFRVTRFMRAWDEAALKVLALARIAMPKLPDPLDVTMMAYSPIEKNREVLRDKFREAYAVMAANPVAFSQEEINKLFVETYSLPPQVLIPIEEQAANVPATPTEGAGQVEPDGIAAGQQAPPSPIPPAVSARLPEGGANPNAPTPVEA